MKKEDLRSALGRIQPREALISATLARMRGEREKQDSTQHSFVSSPAFNRGVRLAGAFCVLALVIGICLASIKGGNIPDSDIAPMSLADTVKARTSDIEPATYSFFDDEENGWILTSGNFGECIYRSDEDENNDIAGGVAMMFKVTELYAYSDTLSVDINKTGVDLVVYADFGDKEYADEFIKEAEEPMIIRVTPTEDGYWTLIDYSSADIE